MHSLIARVFKKKGIEDIKSLTSEDREEYEKWQAILSSKPIQVSTIKEFCQRNIESIESQMIDLDNSDKKNNRLILQYNIYKALIGIIERPQKEKEALEKYLHDLLK